MRSASGRTTAREITRLMPRSSERSGPGISAGILASPRARFTGRDEQVVVVIDYAIQGVALQEPRMPGLTQLPAQAWVCRQAEQAVQHRTGLVGHQQAADPVFHHTAH